MKLYEIIYNYFFGTKQEILREPYGVPHSQRNKMIYSNPLNISFENTVKLDDIDLSNVNFRLSSIEEATIDLNKEKFVVVDYNLQGVAHSQISTSDGKFKEHNVKLRVMADDSLLNESKCRVLLLTKFDELEYDEGFLNHLNDESKKFNIEDDLDDENPDNDIFEEFWRCNDVGVPYFAKVKFIKNFKESTYTKEFWDYSRITKIEETEVEEYIYVEMNKETGFFTLWRGTEMLAKNISVL